MCLTEVSSLNAFPVGTATSIGKALRERYSMLIVEEANFDL